MAVSSGTGQSMGISCCAADLLLNHNLAGIFDNHVSGATLAAAGEPASAGTVASTSGSKVVNSQAGTGRGWGWVSPGAHPSNLPRLQKPEALSK
jgi:hypothetical protein